MKKLTYAEQLAHPRWQRRRLQMLDAAGWICTICLSAEKMLHVHHRQYFKGRMAWEYNDAELQVICVDCHRDAHALDDDLKALLVLVPPHEVFALLVGFYSGMLPEPLIYKAATLSAELVNAGMLASDLRGATPALVGEIYEAMERHSDGGLA